MDDNNKTNTKIQSQKEDSNDVSWGKAALATLSTAPTLVLEDDDDDDEDEDSSMESNESEDQGIQRDTVVGESPRQLIRKHGSRVYKKEIGEPIAEGFFKKKVMPTLLPDHEVRLTKQLIKSSTRCRKLLLFLICWNNDRWLE